MKFVKNYQTLFIHLYSLISVSALSANEFNELQGVKRYRDSTDEVLFTNICNDMFCEKMKAYSTSSTKCQCRCQDEYIFSIAKKECITKNELAGNFTLSDDELNISSISTVTTRQLQDGLFINYCANEKCGQYTKNCMLDKERSFQNLDIWIELNENLFTNFIVFEETGSKIKVQNVANFSIYNGQLLRLALTCTVDGEQISSHATFEITGTFLGPFTFDYISSTEKSKDDMEMLIIAVVLAVLLVISCVLLAIIYRRWKLAKKRSNNNLSDPPLAFEPTTPVFLVQDKSHYEIQNRIAKEIIDVQDSMYNSFEQTERPKRRDTIKSLYASIDKFFKMSVKRKSNDSIDEGYTTDEAFDYKRFSKFPKGLYDEPGSVISSTDEADFRIPEDFEMNIPTYDPTETSWDTSNSKTISLDSMDTIDDRSEPHYDQVGDALKSKLMLSHLPRCPFEGDSGIRLTSRTKITSPTREKYISPYDTTGKPLTKKLTAILDNANDQKELNQEKFVSPYDVVGDVIINYNNFHERMLYNKNDRVALNIQRFSNEQQALTQALPENGDSVKPYDQIGTVLANKLKLSRQKSFDSIDGYDEDYSHQYDEVGTVISSDGTVISCDDVIISNESTVISSEDAIISSDVTVLSSDNGIISSDDTVLSSNVEDDILDTILGNYDIPKTLSPQRKDLSVNTVHNDKASITEILPKRREKKRPPKPPRPESFNLVINTHIEDQHGLKS